MTDPTSPRTLSAERRSQTVEPERERTRAATSSTSFLAACLGQHSKSSSTRQPPSWTKSTPHLCCLPRGGGAPPRPRRCHLCCRRVSPTTSGAHALWVTTHAARAKTRLHPCAWGAKKRWQRWWQNHVCSCCWWSCPPAGAVASAVGWNWRNALGCGQVTCDRLAVALAVAERPSAAFARPPVGCRTRQTDRTKFFGGHVPADDSEFCAKLISLV